MNDLLETAAPAHGDVPSRKWERLESFLSGLAPAAAAKLFAALESGGGAGAGGLPAATVLAFLRTRLVSDGAPFPQRRASARRLFFAPFEDFFVSGRKGRKRRARIDRASLSAIWSLIEEDPACVEAADAARALDAAIARGEIKLSPFEDALHAAAGAGFSRLIEHAENDVIFRADLSARLSAGGEKCPDKRGAAALHDLAEINFLLPAVRYLKTVQAVFPRPLAALTEEDFYNARRIYAACVRAAPQAAPYVPLAIAARMAAIEDALPLYFHFSKIEDDAIPDAAADASFIAEAAFDDLESLARALERAADDDPDTDGIAERFERFGSLAAGLARAAEREGDAAFVNRIEASRDIAADALTRFSECSLSAVRRFLPTRHAGGSSRLMALRPDIARSVDLRDEIAARKSAIFLAGVPALGEGLARGDAVAAIIEDACAETQRYAGDLVAEIRAAEGDRRKAALKRMEAVLRAAAPLLSADKIALLAERAKAAALSA
ncbi:MAG: hypothetical protein AB7F91_06330 [Parvularculaceae bacterium]